MPYSITYGSHRQINQDGGVKSEWVEVEFTANTISELWKEIDDYVNSENPDGMRCVGEYMQEGFPQYNHKDKWKLKMHHKIS